MQKPLELKINARGLTPPGPRMMVETALQNGPCRLMRVVVSSTEAVDDLRAFFEQRGASVVVDQIGEEFHLFVEFKDNRRP